MERVSLDHWIYRLFLSAISLKLDKATEYLEQTTNTRTPVYRHYDNNLQNIILVMLMLLAVYLIITLILTGSVGMCGINDHCHPSHNMFVVLFCIHVVLSFSCFSQDKPRQ